MFEQNDAGEKRVSGRRDWSDAVVWKKSLALFSSIVGISLGLCGAEFVVNLLIDSARLPTALARSTTALAFLTTFVIVFAILGVLVSLVGLGVAMVLRRVRAERP